MQAPIITCYAMKIGVAITLHFLLYVSFSAMNRDHFGEYWKNMTKPVGSHLHYCKFDTLCCQRKKLQRNLHATGTSWNDEISSTEAVAVFTIELPLAEGTNYSCS